MTPPEVYLVRQPMANPFEHGAHRRQASESVVMSWQVGAFKGLGECAPRRYVTGEDCDTVIAQLHRIDFATLERSLASRDPVDRGRALFEQGVFAATATPIGNNTRCLVEMAALDLLAQQAELPLAGFLQAITVTSSIPRRVLPASVGITQVLDLSQSAQTFFNQRAPTGSLKVKLARDLPAACRRLEEVHALDDTLQLFVDPNMSWSVETLGAWAPRLRDLSIDLYEEPLPRGSFDQYRQARLSHGVQIMLDESVSSPATLEHACQREALDVVNLRIAKCGGLLATLKMLEQCRTWGLPAYLGVQVAEVGPLIAAHRALLTAFDAFIAVEAGQHDRFFEQALISPVPAIDRLRNAIHLQAPSPPGLGCSLTGHITQFRYDAVADHPSDTASMERE